MHFTKKLEGYKFKKENLGSSHTDAVARLESFRALNHNTRLETFMVFKSTARLETLRALKLSNLAMNNF